MAALFGVETCNARTRSGGLCQNAPIYPAGRCRMHGGKSLRGIASPRFKHGRYCKDLLGQLCGRIPRRQRQALTLLGLRG